MWLSGNLLLAALNFAFAQEALRRLQAFDHEPPPVSTASASIARSNSLLVSSSASKPLHAPWLLAPPEPPPVRKRRKTSQQPACDNDSETFVVSTSATFPTTVGLGSETAPAETGATEDSYFRMMTNGGNTHGKRQADAAYVGGDGTVSNDCTSAPIYQIRNGSLVAIVDQVPYYYSTNPGVAIQLMVPDPSGERSGSISTTFTLGPRGTLVWNNGAFSNGAATFCSSPNGSIYAVFQQSARPSDCLVVQLNLFTVSSCQGILATYQFPASTITNTQRETYTTFLPPEYIVETYIEPGTTVTYTSFQPGTTLTATTTRPPTTITATTTRPASTVTSTRPANTVTTTAQNSLPCPSVCSNQGLHFGAFNNPYSGGTNNQNGFDSSNPATGRYTGYDPVYLKRPGSGTTGWTTFISNGTASTVSMSGSCGGTFTAGSWVTSANSTTFPCTAFSVNFRGKSCDQHRIPTAKLTVPKRTGYLYVPSSGTWNFAFNNVDDAALLWVGSTAKSGWTKANANINAYFGYGGLSSTDNFYNIDLTAGQYIPFRVVYAQAVGGFGVSFQITGPGNNLIFPVSAGTAPTCYVQQYSCDGNANTGRFPGQMGFEGN